MIFQKVKKSKSLQIYRTSFPLDTAHGSEIQAWLHDHPKMLILNPTVGKINYFPYK